MKTFETYEEVDGLQTVRKKVLTLSKQIPEHFRVKSLEGDYVQGKPGDYLMKGVAGELYICDKDIFDKTYEYV